jgi:hypothetical protein
MWRVDIYEQEKKFYDFESNKANQLKDSLSTRTDEWIDCDEQNLKVGDIIYVEYLPDSQKYLYTYHPQFGKVTEINTEEDYSSIDKKRKSFLSIKIVNQNNKVENLNKEHLSIYSRGYYILIKKYVKKNI